MRIDILTLFPEMFSSLNESIVGKAIEKNLIEINAINIRDVSKDKHKKVDDTPYGGGAGMVIKPDVVLYEEPLPNGVFESAIEAISKCDTFIVGGTSLAVYPANSLVQFFHGKNLVVINKDKTSLDKKATLVIHDDIAKVFSKIKTD